MITQFGKNPQNNTEVRKKDKGKGKGKGRVKEKGKRKGKEKDVKIGSLCGLKWILIMMKKRRKFGIRSQFSFFNWSLGNIYSYGIILMSCILRKMYVIASLKLYLIF